MSNRVAIIGIGQTHHKSSRVDVCHEEMVNEAARAALDDAGLGIADIETVINGNMDMFEGHNLFDTITVTGSGAYLKQGMKINTGGTTGASLFAAAWYHVASGVFDLALVIGSEKQEECQRNSQSAMITASDPVTLRPFHTGALGSLALVAAKFKDTTGCPEEAAAKVRVIAAENALKNPYSHLKLKLTVEDVMQSKMLINPIRLLHMCPQSNGACAMVLASEDKAKKLSNKPVWINDVITVHTESFRRALSGASFDPPSQSIAATRLYKRNGITKPMEQIDVVEMYEPSSWSQLQWMEEFLFCDKGEAWKLVDKGVTELDGAFPINPSGGVQSTNPIGATAMLRVAECALQVRGTGEDRQVAKKVNTGLATAFGGSNWTVLTLLTKQLS